MSRDSLRQEWRQVPIRLIATDLDGTLLRDDGGISSYTRATLVRAQDKGLVLVLVTARSPRTLRVKAGEIGLAGLAICCNGALTYDLTAGAIVDEYPLAPNVAHRIIEGLRKVAPGVCFAVEKGMRAGQEPTFAFVQRELARAHGLQDGQEPYLGADEDQAPLIADALTLCETDVTKLLVLHPEISVAELLHATREIAGSDAAVTRSSSLFVEIAKSGITKASALLSLGTKLEIESQHVLAFGDMPNDIPMLQWAGHSVAVANAHLDVQATVNEVTKTNNEDGVALVIERFLHDLFP